ncbi:2610_t:CDS:2, partial [Acaulospora morrowiae]
MIERDNSRRVILYKISVLWHNAIFPFREAEKYSSCFGGSGRLPGNRKNMRNACFVGGEAEKHVEKDELEAEKNTVFVGGDSSMGT